jgi:U3 small nucleolar RNA-associated protein 18
MLYYVVYTDLPIHCAQMTHDGSEIVVSGRRPYFYTYNVETGDVLRVPGIRGMHEKSYEQFQISHDSKLLVFTCNNGYIALVDRQSKQSIGTLKMNGLVRSVAFSNDNKHLYTYGDQSDIYVWDIATRQCIARHYDNAGVHGNSITVANNGMHYATGSDSGIVNIYSVDNLHKHINTTSNIQPVHTLTNITVPIDNLLYNHDSQILCASSKRIKDVLKLYNTTHNYSSFSNWPTVNTPLHYVSCSAFSPNSGYLAVGNDRGRVLLYRLKHYNTS